MFLQTLLQLNILILATPALAGWSLMPLAQPGAVRAACVIWQVRSVEAVAPKTQQAQTEEKQGAERKHLPVLPRRTQPNAILPGDKPCVYFAAPADARVCDHPFPHATRAP